MRARVCVCVRINDESIGFLMTVFAVYFYFTRLGIFRFVHYSIFLLFIRFIAYTFAENKIYSSRNFLTDIFTRANIDKKITQRINLILHSRVCDNIYVFLHAVSDGVFGGNLSRPSSVAWQAKHDLSSSSTAFLYGLSSAQLE